MMHALALLGKEPRKDALIVERLDQLPLYAADHRGSDARRGLNRLAMLKPLFDVFPLELSSWCPI